MNMISHPDELSELTHDELGAIRQALTDVYGVTGQFMKITSCYRAVFLAGKKARTEEPA